MTATKKQRKLLGKYVRWVANEMELRDWTIIIGHDPPIEDKYGATIECIYGRKRATIRFCKDFMTSHSPEQQRSTIAHELIHCHFKGIEWQFNNLNNQIAPGVFHAVWGGILDQMEFGIDAMADAVAKHLPLPKQVKVKGAE